MQLLVLFFASCAALSSARPQQNSGYDYPAPQGGGVTGAFESLRQPGGRPSSEIGQRVPTFQQQLTSREAGFQISSQETGGFHQGVAAPGFGSQEQGVGQQAVYDSSAELQIGLRQPGVGGSFAQGVRQSQQPTSPALGSFENVRSTPGQFQADFGSRESGPGIRASRPGLLSAEILAPGPVQDTSSGFRPTQGSTQELFQPLQVPAGQAVGFPARQQPGQFSSHQTLGSPIQQQPSQFGVGVSQQAQPGVSPTDFATQAHQRGHGEGPLGLTGTPQTQVSDQSQRAPGQSFQDATIRGSPEDSLSAPAQYNFKWDVNDPESGNFYGHQEERDGALTRGRYYVTLPDTRVMTVDYYADETGYHPTITFEGEAQQFIPPPRQTTAAEGSAQGATSDHQQTRTGLQGTVPAGFPGLTDGVISQPQILRGTGTQAQTQIPQQFASQIPGQPRVSQGIATSAPPTQGFVRSPQQTTTPGLSQTPGVGFGSPTQSSASISGNLGTPQTGFFGSQQQPSLRAPHPGTQSLLQQPGFDQQQQTPVSVQPQVGAQSFSTQQQGQAFGGQPQGQGFGVQPQLSVAPESHIRGFSSAEQRGQSGFQPSQRIAGTQGQGAQQPDQLYRTPQQGSPSPGSQFVTRFNGFPQQSGETSRQTSFEQNQHPTIHSSGEIQGFRGQQPGQTFGQQPSQALTQQPSQGFGQQPSEELGQHPSLGFGQRPSQGFGQQPSPGFVQQPSAGLAQQSSPGFGQQPPQRFAQQSSPGFGQQPPQSSGKLSAETYEPQPAQGVGQQSIQGGLGQQSTLGSQATTTQPFASSQEQVGPGFLRVPSGLGISTTPGRPVPQRPTQLYGPPQA